MPVGMLRLHLRRHRVSALLLFAAAMLVKALVPAGYMPVVAGHSISLALCSGFGPEKMAMSMPGMQRHRGDADHSGRSDMPCGFAGHAAPSMAGADPVLLVLAVAYVVATLFRIPIAGRSYRFSYLRPHPRGPPGKLLY